MNYKNLIFLSVLLFGVQNTKPFQDVPSAMLGIFFGVGGIALSYTLNNYEKLIGCAAIAMSAYLATQRKDDELERFNTQLKIENERLQKRCSELEKDKY